MVLKIFNKNILSSGDDAKIQYNFYFSFRRHCNQGNFDQVRAFRQQIRSFKNNWQWFLTLGYPKCHN